MEAASIIANAGESAENALTPPKVKISCKKHLEREARRSKSFQVTACGVDCCECRSSCGEGQLSCGTLLTFDLLLSVNILRMYFCLSDIRTQRLANSSMCELPGVEILASCHWKGQDLF